MKNIYIEAAKTEREYRKLRKLSQELGLPAPEAFLEMEVVMPDGRVIHHHKQRSHSWVRNAYNDLFAQIFCCPLVDNAFGAGLLSLKNTAGAVVFSADKAVLHAGTDTAAQMTWTGANPTYGERAGAGVTDFGIVVGSGANVESFEDFALQTLIAHGVGAGQLSYIATNEHTTSYAALTKTISLLRFMNNNSGGDVTVRECGIIVKGIFHNEATHTVMLSRDHLAADVVIPNTGQLRVTYNWQLAYPA